jgi:lipopolysaccharide export system protein LptC
VSAKADQIRSRRRHLAAPGGSFDRMIGFLALALPAAVGAVAATMIVTPLSPRGEVSFLLDRNKVAIANDRLLVDNAMYRGEDNRGRPFSVAAGSAVQASAAVPVVRMQQMVARLLLPDGPAMLTAPAGRYNIDNEVVAVDGITRFVASGGYRMDASNVSVDMNERVLRGDGRVEGSVPAGSFSADSITANLDDRTVALVGNARLRMTPGQMQMP